MYQMNADEIPLWEPNFPQDDYFSALFVASRKSGKTYLARHLLKEYWVDQYDVIIIVSPSAKDSRLYLEEVKDKVAMYRAKGIDKQVLHIDQFNPQAVDNAMKRNTLRLEKDQEPVNYLFVVDDSGDRKLANNPILLNLFNRGRHCACSVAYICQNYSQLGSWARNNSNLIFIMRNMSPNGKKLVRKDLLEESVDLDEGGQKEATKKWVRLQREYLSTPGNCLVLDFLSGDGNLQKYRAP